MTDREILRSLAGEYAQAAAMERNHQNAQLYRALNRRQMIRPVVLIDEIPWSQLRMMEELREYCEGEKERRAERFFRRQLYRWKHFPCDMILTPFFPWPRHIQMGSFGIDIQADILAYDKGNNIVSHAYTDQIPDETAIEKLHVPDITLDEEADARDREWLESIFGDILPVRLTGLEYAAFFQPWDDIAQWRGVEPLLWDLIDRPEFTHALVEKILNVRLALLDKVEALHLLDNASPYLHSTAGLCDELPGDGHSGCLTRKNIWGRGAAQIFASVSPAMTEAFEIDYACRFFEGFGLLYYGCCEPLHHKIDILRRLPNLRKISITPWADVDSAADQIGCDYVMANKPNPAFLAVGRLDETVVEKEIRKALNACRRNGTSVELTLKDISSIHYNPANLDRWAQIAMRLVQE